MQPNVRRVLWQRGKLNLRSLR